MPAERVNTAPVEHVGGPQDRGPWPSEIDDIAVDDRLTRPVEIEPGVTEQRDVVVTDIQQIVRADGTETDGYVVSYQWQW